MSLNHRLKLDGNKLCCVILATLAALQILLYSRYTNSFSDILLQGLVVTGLFWQVYQKQCHLSLKKDFLGQLLGIILILLLLLRAKYIFLTEASVFGYFVSWFTLIGYILLIAGFHGLRFFRKEISICVALTLINPLLAGIRFFLERSEYISITVISAKLTTFLLWYVGFDASSQGQVVYVNGGAIDIYLGCTGVSLFLELLKFSLLIILLFRSLCPNLPNLSLLFTIPAILSLIFSTIRLAIMAVVVNHPEAFEFWHGTEGSNLFITIALILFFGLILFTAPPQAENPRIIPQIPLNAQPATPLWLLRSSSILLILILLNFIFGSPIAGANSIADYDFPAVFNLPHWNLIQSESEALIKRKKDRNTDVIEFDQSLSQRSYVYQRGDESLMVNLRYIINTFGGLSSYYNKTFENLPSVEQETQVQDRDNYYLKFSSEERQYQTACLNGEGKTTVTGSQFVSYFRQGYINPSKLLSWLFGKRLLQDRRCLWIELSTPLESTLKDSERLRVWQFFVDYWRSNFPPVRN